MEKRISQPFDDILARFRKWATSKVKLEKCYLLMLKVDVQPRAQRFVKLEKLDKTFLVAVARNTLVMYNYGGTV